LNRSQRIPSLGVLVRADDPFSDRDALVRRLRSERPESRCLEWKLTLPIGSAATLRTKCRTIKAALSFANTEGGFIVFGVDPTGKWVGLSDAALAEADPAALVELINSHVSPRLPSINYAEITSRARKYTVLHIPPSAEMPHVRFS
jgi:predicted HTH transcriptional regulator